MNSPPPYPAPFADLLSRIDAREAGLSSDPALKARMDRINGRLGPSRDDEERLWRAAGSATSPRKKVLWLRRALEPVLNAVATEIACKPGCAHCCRIPVQVTEREARVISRETGRPLREPAADRSLLLSRSSLKAGSIAEDEFQIELDRFRDFQAEEVRRHYGEACPFLEQHASHDPGSGMCTIYGSRPLVCRHLVNLDHDALLCHVVPGREVQVPHLNMKLHSAIQISLLGMGQRVAEIRSWFGWPGSPVNSATSANDAD